MSGVKVQLSAVGAASTPANRQAKYVVPAGKTFTGKCIIVSSCVTDTNEIVFNVNGVGYCTTTSLDPSVTTNYSQGEYPSPSALTMIPAVWIRHNGASTAVEGVPYMCEYPIHLASNDSFNCSINVGGSTSSSNCISLVLTGIEQ